MRELISRQRRDLDTYAELLRKCARAKDLFEGRKVHRELVDDGYEGSINIGNLLVQMYGKCNSLSDAKMAFERIPDKTVFSWNIMAGAYAQNGHMEEAKSVFDSTPVKSVSSWNAMISAYVKSGDMAEAKRLFNQMEEKSEVSWNLMITACAQKGLLQDAKSMFDTLPTPTLSNFTSMISGYAKLGLLEEARALFDSMPEKNLTSRTAMVSAYAQNGHIDEAREMFECAASQGDVHLWTTMIQGYLSLDRLDEACGLLERMSMEGFRPERTTYLSLLNSCAQFSLEKLGRSIHGRLREIELETDVAMATALLTMYGRCGELEDVKCIFQKMVSKDVVAWTALVSAFGQQDHIQLARQAFDRMTHWNVVSWTAIITAYADGGHLREAGDMYNGMPQQNRISMTAILTGYARNGYLEDAKILFHRMEDRDVVAWTAIINAHAQNFEDVRALHLFKLMDLEGVRPNKTTFLAALEACSNTGSLSLGRHLHKSIKESGCQSSMMVRSALINMYGKCGSIPEAKSLFESIPDPDTVSCNAMLAGYAQNGDLPEAKSMFDRMPRRPLCCWNSIITAYAQSGDIAQATSLFELTKQKDVVTWTGMVKAYTLAGQPKRAFEYFMRMDVEGVKPNRVTYLHVCEVCGLLADGTIARMVHDEMMHTCLHADAVLGTAVVNMYGSCASLENAKSFFDRMLRQYVEPWNALLGSYSQNGLASEVLGLFQLMVLDGLRPNSSTFVNVLAASSHAGLTVDGWTCFRGISSDFGLQPAVDHFVCMVDILARAGRLKDAEELIQTMPYEPEALAWTSLLGACSLNRDKDRAKRAAEYAFNLDPGNSAPYALLTSVCKHKDGSEGVDLNPEEAILSR